MGSKAPINNIMLNCPLANFFGSKNCFKNLDNQKLLIIYKLLHDSLFLVLSALFFSLIFEGILPGIITAHVGFSKIVVGILINIFLIQRLAGMIASEKNTSTDQPRKSELNLLLAIIFIGIFLLFNVQLGINNSLNLSIVLGFVAIGYLLFEMFFNDKNARP